MTGWGNAIIPAEYQLKPLWTTKYEPKSIDSYYGFWGLMNIPQIAYYSQKSSTELKYQKLQIQLNDPSDTETADKIVR